MAEANFVALKGLNYPDGKGGEVRAEVGEIIPAGALPSSAIKWLRESGAIAVEGEVPVVIPKESDAPVPDALVPPDDELDDDDEDDD